ncbi:gamma-glutamylcyclotransferase family protein [Clostridium oceanicum]|uniref:Gamma-glutamylcyclotransferase n=1 Tax=Clostridium oceanicum TaxID=1543 RepID=A0ABN1JN25_9CLOT
MIQKLFVYGTLMEDFYNYDKYLKDQVITLEKATFKGKLYHMPKKGYPALLPGNDDILGEIITIKNWDENLNLMDKMEHFFGENDSSNEYNRKVIEVKISKDNEIITEKAYSYLYNLSEKDKENFKDEFIYIPSGNWRDYMENKK